MDWRWGCSWEVIEGFEGGLAFVDMVIVGIERFCFGF